MTLALYGHPFSSYTWKARIALYAEDIAHEFRIVDGDHPEHTGVVQSTGPAGKFPILVDGDTLLFETITIIEHLALHHASAGNLIPLDPVAALKARQLDRVFDNYVMGNMQNIVDEHLRDRDSPDQARIAEARARLERTYAWLESWLPSYAAGDRITLVECAAAPSLFYADWVHPIDGYPRLQAWRAQLLALPAVSRCVEDARPYRPWFPLGAPDRD